MIEASYVPFSIREWVENEDLGKLLDYIERQLGLDIACWVSFKDSKQWSIYSVCIVANQLEIHIDLDKHVVVRVHNNIWIYAFMSLDLFYATYTSLLPVIRDQAWESLYEPCINSKPWYTSIVNS